MAAVITTTKPAMFYLVNIFALISLANTEVIFYKDTDFKGPLEYNVTLEKMFFHVWKPCVNFGNHEGQVSSLRTSECLIAYSQEKCSDLGDSYQAKISPGEYPDFPKFLQSHHYPCAAVSFRNCSEVFRTPADEIPGVALFEGYHRFLMWKRPYRNREPKLAEIRNLCGCTNLPNSIYGKVGALWNFETCVALFSGRNCEGESVEILGGDTPPGRDLRLVGFNGLAKSLSVCKPAPLQEACKGQNETGQVWKINRRMEKFSETNEEDEENEIEIQGENENLANSDFLLETKTCSENSSENFTCSRSCGGVMRSDKGAIWHKVEESLESFERCVWIVRQPLNRSRFDVNVVWNGFKPKRGKMELLVWGYDGNQYPDNPTHRINRTGNHFGVDGALMVITFYTNELLEADMKYSGFVLEFNTVVDSPEIPVSPFSSDYRMEFGDSMHYPAWSPQKSDYYNEELSTFLFLRGDRNIRMEELRSGSKNYVVNISQWDVAVPESDRWNRDQDEVVAYFFRRDDWAPTQLEDRISKFRSNEESENVAISNDDIIFLIFRSNKGKTGTGFSLSSSVEESVVCPVTYNFGSVSAASHSFLLFSANLYLLWFNLPIICLM